MKFDPLNSTNLADYQTDLAELLADVYVSNFRISESDARMLSEEKLASLKVYLAEHKAIVVLAVVDSRLVGFIWLYRHRYFGEERLHVNHLAVKSEWRGHGVGKDLIREAEQLAVELGADSIDLVVSENNHVAVKLYHQLGFYTERRYMKKQLADKMFSDI